uniref:Pre-mRNA-splicing factor Syf1/CRNKL1-like C-terminal HAT-repeats domain-containing protein n=1 Tax=Anopheles minimus TaxID=112268 RepID=A0A182VQ69_9DIPT
MRLLKEGRTVAVVQTNTDTYSMRLIPYFKEHPKHIESVESGALLKGSCSTVNGVLYVTPLLSNFSQQIEVKRKENYCEVKDGSIMMMRVLDVKKSSKEGYNLHVSTALLDVCENGKQDVFNFMVEYLKDVKNLIQRYQEANYAFANYTLGELVECVVESIVPESNKLAVEVRAIDKETKNAAKGIATAILPNQPASSYKVGKKVPGRVVWIDVERKLVHVCLDPPLVERILPEDSPMGTKYPVNPVQCWVLFANNYVQVCCLQTVPLNALVIVPVKHHYNDMVDRGNNTTNTVKVRLLWNYEKMFFAMQEQMVLFYEMCFATAHAKQGRIHRQQASKTIDEPSINKEDESENDAYDVSPMEGMTRVADNEGEDADATYDRMDEESDDGLSIPTPTTRSIINGKKQKKKATSKSSKKGDDKTKRKRKIVAEAMENVEQKQLALKKKKKKISPAEDLEVATVAKQPKSVSEKGKKSILLIGNRVSAEKPKLKKKKSPFVIDQLDGANDFYLQQLDGTGDIAMGEDKKEGARKRKRTTDGKGLPGAINFWDSTPVYKRTVSDSSDDEAQNSDDEQCETVGKMRLSAKERFEAMKKEEERLRKIEDELANPSMDPHTPDQFDRLVLAQPNNSMLWIRYMAFHMESAELDKARAVGRKALKAIHFREETDRLNVWMALLNLEIRYETVDSFKEVLQEAVQYNDAFKVYSRAVDILIDCQKHAEVQELLELLLKKFRKQNDMWFLVADAWYRIGQGGKVKPLLSQALKSLPVREHIPIIVKFAFLHNRNENRDEAHLLFEQILTSYPKRTDIWSQYIDMLVKDDLVGNARQILERAIMQRLPMKNMKTLYTKYVNFEETHGDRDSVRRVKQMAADYVQAQLNNAGIK